MPYRVRVLQPSHTHTLRTALRRKILQSLSWISHCSFEVTRLSVRGFDSLIVLRSWNFLPPCPASGGTQPCTSRSSRLGFFRSVRIRESPLPFDCCISLVVLRYQGFAAASSLAPAKGYLRSQRRALDPHSDNHSFHSPHHQLVRSLPWNH